MGLWLKNKKAAGNTCGLKEKLCNVTRNCSDVPQVRSFLPPKRTSVREEIKTGEDGVQLDS
jgi:hypothetical protein